MWCCTFDIVLLEFYVGWSYRVGVIIKNILLQYKSQKGITDNVDNFRIQDTLR